MKFRRIQRGDVCYVVRNSEGCKIDPDDQDLVGINVRIARTLNQISPASCSNEVAR